jgi:hopanoid biosynthesis associated radical SAM protein HpnH
MGIPLLQTAKIGAYVLKQQIMRREKYPLVLMLEPLFRCNLACAGCGKIDYPAEILNQRLSVAEILEAVDECGAPVVTIAGGEPLLHKELPEAVEKIIQRGKFVYLCTNALLMEKKIDDYKPSPYFTWTVHLDGDKKHHDKSVCQDGVYEKAVSAIKLAKSKGFRVNINCTLFDGTDPEAIAKFFDEVTALGLDGITVSPGYAYERAPDQQHFLNRTKTKTLFREIFKRGNGGKNWQFSQSTLFLDFLAGNQAYECTPWAMPCRNYFGWQRPCYLLGEGYAKTFTELMETTDWDSYGVGNYEKCSNCMVHSGFEGTAAKAALKNPLKLALLQMRGIETEKPMVADIPLDKARPAKFVFSAHVQQAMAKLKHEKPANQQKEIA